MIIRNAKKSDISSLVKLDQEANKETAWWTPMTESDFLKLLKEKDLLFVAEQDKEIIGYLSGKLNLNKEIVLLENVFVKEGFRKKGIAKKLINAFSSKWIAPKYKIIQLNCPERLREFYNKLGFKVSALIMKRKLK